MWLKGLSAVDRFHFPGVVYVYGANSTSVQCKDRASTEFNFTPHSSVQLSKVYLNVVTICDECWIEVFGRGWSESSKPDRKGCTVCSPTHESAVSEECDWNCKVFIAIQMLWHQTNTAKAQPDPNEIDSHTLVNFRLDLWASAEVEQHTGSEGTTEMFGCAVCFCSICLFLCSNWL